jgi:hypothetical protein
MLFGLGLGCSLLAGFGMAASAGHSWIHMVLFAATLTVALYVVTDMEYPRLGLIRRGFRSFSQRCLRSNALTAAATAAASHLIVTTPDYQA